MAYTENFEVKVSAILFGGGVYWCSNGGGTEAILYSLGTLAATIALLAKIFQKNNEREIYEEEDRGPLLSSLGQKFLLANAENDMVAIRQIQQELLPIKDHNEYSSRLYGMIEKILAWNNHPAKNVSLVWIILLAIVITMSVLLFFDKG